MPFSPLERQARFKSEKSNFRENTYVISITSTRADDELQLFVMSRSPGSQEAQMAIHDSFAEQLIEKIRQLPPDKVAQVEDFIDFLRIRTHERSLSNAITKLSEPSLEKVWDNPDDDEYNTL